ncbi:MAG TPA: hypothetical protein VGL72_06950 [Bryobacteraceae bacterium]|jgi:hypothetical protein
MSFTPFAVKMNAVPAEFPVCIETGSMCIFLGGSEDDGCAMMLVNLPHIHRSV